MSEQEAHQTGSITDSESEKENELIVNNDPVMKTAIDILSKFSLTNKLILKGYSLKFLDRDVQERNERNEA